MGVLKQQKEILSGLFYSDFKKIFCEGGGGAVRGTNKPTVTFKVCSLLMIKASAGILPSCKEMNKK